MRVVSLLPALTELVCALGHGEDLVGITHECDFPPSVEGLPRLTRSRIPGSARSAEIDEAVSEQGGSLYDLDPVRLAEVRPTLILTQEQCDVCAVNEATVRRVASTLQGTPWVESVDPRCMADLHAMFRRVGELLGASEAAEALVETFETTAAEIARRTQGRVPRTTLVLEWFDPPFSAGHWNPEIVALAGGLEVLGKVGERSRRVTWDEIVALDPERILLSPCGFTLERSEEEIPGLLASAHWRRLSAVREGGVTLVDGSAFFSRPGPRLEASLRIAAAAIDPNLTGDLAPPEGWSRLPPL